MRHVAARDPRKRGDGRGDGEEPTPRPAPTAPPRRQDGTARAASPHVTAAGRPCTGPDHILDCVDGVFGGRSRTRPRAGRVPDRVINGVLAGESRGRPPART